MLYISVIFSRNENARRWWLTSWSRSWLDVSCAQIHRISWSYLYLINMKSIFSSGNPSENDVATADPYKTLFISRLVSWNIEYRTTRNGEFILLFIFAFFSSFYRITRPRKARYDASSNSMEQSNRYGKLFTQPRWTAFTFVFIFIINGGVPGLFTIDHVSCGRSL